VDLNRAGTPLLEIVSAPDMRSIAEAEVYMHTLRRILLYTEVSDCKMQEGSLRFEASISLRKPGQKEYGARVEIKNLNSMKAVGKCLDYEVRRQTEILDQGGAVDRETRLWDDQHERSERMRSKEEAQDYRYFPEPDLVPFVVDDAWLERLRAEVPELPQERRARFVSELGLTEYDAGVLTDEPALARYFETCLKGYDEPKSAAHWIMNVVLAILNDRKIGIAEFNVAPEKLAELIRMADEKKVTAQAARDVLAKMMETGKDAPTLVRETGAGTIASASDLEPIVARAMAEAPKAVQDYLGGKEKALGALVGQVMRLTKGQADANVVRELLVKKLKQPKR
jgi:aspartyl-tRNA(Asn)/glutamyl-tRNA(Gln) amidotransferase subunit B